MVKLVMQFADKMAACLEDR